MSDVVNRQRSPVASLYRPILWGSLAFSFLAFALPIYSRSLGANALTIGGLYSVFTVTTLVLRPVVGWALDRFGRKRFFVAALFGYAIAMGLFAFASTVAGLYLARGMQGIASSLMWISVHTIVVDLVSSRERGRTMGRVREMTARGEVYGALGGFFLFSLLPGSINWQIVFAGYAVMAAAGAWLALRNVPETRPPVSVAVKNQRTIPRQLLKLMAIVFVTGASAAMISPIYLIFLQDKFTTDIPVLAWAFLPAGIVSSYLSSHLGGLGDRFGRVPMMAAGLAGGGLLSLLLPGLPNLGWLIVLYTLSALVSCVAAPAQTAIVADLIGSEARGRGYGLYDLAGSLGAALGPLLGGWLYDAAGEAVPFYLNGTVLLVSAVLAFLLLRRQTPQVAETTLEFEPDADP